MLVLKPLFRTSGSASFIVKIASPRGASFTDVILFTPFEVNLLDMLERSEITTPEEFFATHHIYAATGQSQKTCSLNCHIMIEINLADKEESVCVQRASEFEEKLKSLRS